MGLRCPGNQGLRDGPSPVDVAAIAFFTQAVRKSCTMPCNAPAASREFPDWLRPAPLTGAASEPAVPPRSRPERGTAPPAGVSVVVMVFFVVVFVVVLAPLRRPDPLAASVSRPRWGSVPVAGFGVWGVGGRFDGAAVHRCGARPARPVPPGVEVTLPSARTGAGRARCSSSPRPPTPRPTSRSQSQPRAGWTPPVRPAAKRSRRSSLGLTGWAGFRAVPRTARPRSASSAHRRGG